MEATSRSVVLLSGGVDSATVAHLEAQRGRLTAGVFVDYGQPAAAHERRAARWIAADLRVPLHEVALPLPLGAMADEAGEPGARVVPGRNLTLSALAVAYAAAHGAEYVVLGATASDQAAYPDCRRSFVRALNGICRTAYGVQLEAPLVGDSKADVLALAASLGVKLASTWSCYTPDGDDPCGTCGSCEERAAAGIPVSVLPPLFLTPAERRAEIAEGTEAAVAKSNDHALSIVLAQRDAALKELGRL